jgi:hypothetical protein
MVVQDVGSQSTVEVDGTAIPKQEAVELHPGAVIKFTDSSVYGVYAML